MTHKQILSLILYLSLHHQNAFFGMHVNQRSSRSLHVQSNKGCRRWWCHRPVLGQM